MPLLQLRITEDEAARIKAAANKAKQNVPAYVRQHVPELGKARPRGRQRVAKKAFATPTDSTPAP